MTRTTVTSSNQMKTIPIRSQIYSTAIKCTLTSMKWQDCETDDKLTARTKTTHQPQRTHFLLFLSQRYATIIEVIVIGMKGSSVKH